MTRPTEPTELYAWLKREIAKLEDEMDNLKDDVLKIVVEKDGELEGDGYVIKSIKRPKYKYSDVYDSKNDELKKLRAEEIENGTAVIDGYSEFVKINFKKEKA